MTEAERTMLDYALDQAQEHIWSEDGFTDEDQEAVTSLRLLVTAPTRDQEDRSTSSEPYPDPPDFYFGVTVPDYLKDDWARSPGHAFRMGVLNTISLITQYHDIGDLQDDWGHMCKTDADRRTAWLRGEW